MIRESKASLVCKRLYPKLGIVACAFNPRTWEVERLVDPYEFKVSMVPE